MSFPPSFIFLFSWDKKNSRAFIFIIDKKSNIVAIDLVVVVAVVVVVVVYLLALVSPRNTVKFLQTIFSRLELTKDDNITQ